MNPSRDLRNRPDGRFTRPCPDHIRCDFLRAMLKKMKSTLITFGVFNIKYILSRGFPMPSVTLFRRSFLSAGICGVSLIGLHANILGGASLVGPANASTCMILPSDFVQVTMTRTMFGASTHDAWRVFPDGRVEQARWTSDRRLLRHARGQATVAVYAVLRDAAAQRPARTAQDPTMMAQPAPLRHDIAHQRRDSAVIGGGGELSDTLTRAIDALNAVLQPQSLPVGGAIWTQPVADVGRVDYDLRRADCPAAGWLGAALSRGDLLAPLTSEAAILDQGDNGSRGAFGLRFSGGFMLFGPVRP